MQEATFREELQSLISKHGQDNLSQTQDAILAQYLFDCLQSFNRAVELREKWYGREITQQIAKPFPKPLDYPSVDLRDPTPTASSPAVRLGEPNAANRI